MNKQKTLENIAKEIEQCEICKIGKSGKAVPGEGNPNATSMLVGEAPGKTEAETGRPFNGRSGKLLRSLLHENGIKDSDVFITSVVKYLPDRGTPSPSDIAHGKIHLDKQIATIDPKIILLLGSVACQGVLGEKIPITLMHGKTIQKDKKTYIVMFHPAAGLRFPPIKIKLQEDFRQISALLKI